MEDNIKISMLSSKNFFGGIFPRAFKKSICFFDFNCFGMQSYSHKRAYRELIRPYICLACA